jgi:hypothetical protein
MLDIFTHVPLGTLATQNNPNASNVAKAIRENLKRAITYQSKPEWYVRNEHVLVRLLKMMPAPSSNIPSEIYFGGIDLVGMVDGALGILSEENAQSKGNRGNFYSEGITEILFDFRSTVPIAHFARDLFNYSAAKVFYHPYTCLDFKPIDGGVSYPSPSAPYCAIGIDIALLYTQYHVWADQQRDKNPAPTVNNFVFQFVLARLLESHIAQAIGNRFIAIYTNREDKLSNVVTRAPYSIVDNSKAIDDLLRGQVDVIRRGKLDFSTLMGSVPVLEQSLLETSRIPRLPRVNQMFFVKLVSRVELMIALGLNDMNGPTGANGDAMRYWDSLYRRLERDVLTEAVLPKEATLRLVELSKVIRNDVRL